MQLQSLLEWKYKWQLTMGRESANNARWKFKISYGYLIMTITNQFNFNSNEKVWGVIVAIKWYAPTRCLSCRSCLCCITEWSRVTMVQAWDPISVNNVWWNSRLKTRNANHPRTNVCTCTDFTNDCRENIHFGHRNISWFTMWCVFFLHRIDVWIDTH